VVGLATWSLALDGRPVDAFPVARDAEAATRLVLEAARSRTDNSPHTRADG
jgi:hypothetical protein